ncbi:hypothetical protein B4U79_01248, partial [Dinothrombium tinctorium]
FKMLQMESEKNERFVDEVNESMKLVIKLKKRYSGKTIPPEKFACTRAQRYLDDSLEPITALLELFYVWNIFDCINDQSKIEFFVSRINERSNALRENEPREMVYDEIASLSLVKGVLMRNLGRIDEAIHCFESVVEIKRLIQNDTFLPHFAAAELGVTYFECGDYSKSLEWLKTARSTDRKFLYETALHVRVHAYMKKIKASE